MNLKPEANESRQRYRREAAQTFGGCAPKFDRFKFISFLLCVRTHSKQLIRLVNTRVPFLMALWRQNGATTTPLQISHQSTALFEMIDYLFREILLSLGDGAYGRNQFAAQHVLMKISLRAQAHGPPDAITVI
jgi:hypothetical protein